MIFSVHTSLGARLVYVDAKLQTTGCIWSNYLKNAIKKKIKNYSLKYLQVHSQYALYKGKNEEDTECYHIHCEPPQSPVDHNNLIKH